MCTPEVCRRRIHRGAEVSRDDPLEVPLADAIYPLAHSSRDLHGTHQFALMAQKKLPFWANVSRALRMYKGRRQLLSDEP